MAEYSEEVEKLAETLKNSGLSASMEDALLKAQSMIGKKEEIKEEIVEKEEDVAQTTLGGVNAPQVKESVQESSETGDELKKEEVFTDKTASEEVSEGKQERPTNQKKIDLTEVFNVNK